MEVFPQIGKWLVGGVPASLGWTCGKNKVNTEGDVRVHEMTGVNTKADAGGGAWKGTLSGMGLEMVPGARHSVLGRCLGREDAAAHG